MSDFLSCAEYEKMAASLSFPKQAFINGKFVDAVSGKTMETTNPATGASIAHIASCGKEDVDLAVKGARAAFEKGVWSKMHPTERKKIFLKFIALIEKTRLNWLFSNPSTAGSL